jgi:16S rRNA (guanine966-N2)-methyltransferase
VRVISGEAKGRLLKTPADANIRPTADKVKGALFNIIGREVIDARVLDLFAGTGNLGIEALSRGAKSVLFVDAVQRAVSLVMENLALLHFETRSIVWRADVFSALRRLKRKGQHFDLVLCDPPYGSRFSQKTLYLLIQYGLVEEDGLVIVEHRRSEKLYVDSTALREVDSRRFGDTVLTFFRWKAEL